MSILDAVKTRRSIRKFLSKPIPSDAVARLKEALIWAPSAGNLQARKFFFVSEATMKERIASAALNQTFIATAPLVVVACTDSRIERHYGERGLRLYTIQDVAASIMAMMLVAQDLKLGTVWVGAFHEEEMSDILNLPPNLRPVAVVPTGYPSSVPSAPPRVSPEEATMDIA